MIDGDILFLGWNECARNVLDKLFEHGALAADRKVVVVSQRPLVGDDRIVLVAGDFSAASVQSGLDWSSTNLVVVFFEQQANESLADADAQNVLACIQAAKHVEHVIVEVHDEHHASMLRKHLGQKVEVIFKEEMDAILIAHTIINPGKTTELLSDLASLENNRIKTFTLRDFSSEDALSVHELRTILLDLDEPILFLGLLERGEVIPTLTPPNDTVLTSDHLLYCLFRE